MTIDTASLGAGEAGALEHAVRQARFLELPPQLGAAAAGAADYHTYHITVEDGEHANTVCVVEPIADPALRELVSRIEQQRRRALGA